MLNSQIKLEIREYEKKIKEINIVSLKIKYMVTNLVTEDLNILLNQSQMI
jgi:hypothetical protein